VGAKGRKREMPEFYTTGERGKGKRKGASDRRAIRCKGARGEGKRQETEGI
jgi:hypothetical protein